MKLANYVGGRWVEGTGPGAKLIDPVLGDELATASTEGVDLKAALAYARETGGPALRKLSYGERAALLEQPEVGHKGRGGVRCCDGGA